MSDIESAPSRAEEPLKRKSKQALLHKRTLFPNVCDRPDPPDPFSLTQTATNAFPRLPAPAPPDNVELETQFAQRVH